MPVVYSDAPPSAHPCATHHHQHHQKRAFCDCLSKPKVYAFPFPVSRKMERFLLNSPGQLLSRKFLFPSEDAFCIVSIMTAHEKILAKMGKNPAGDWTLADLKTVAKSRGWTWRQPGTSYVTFRTPIGRMLTVPAHKPGKAVYVREFLRLLEEE